MLLGSASLKCQVVEVKLKLKLKLTVRHYVTVTMSCLSLFLHSNIKGESLHSLLHKTGQELQFSAMTKYLNQIAQVRERERERGRERESYSR